MTRKKLLFLALSTFCFSAFSQLQKDTLSINTLNVTALADGSIENVGFAPDSTVASLLFTQVLWKGGMDIQNKLHVSSQTYRQGEISYSPGPVSNDPNATTKYNKVWRVQLSTLTDFVNGNLSTIPPEIADWPAHGDVSMGEAADLAPFVDVDNDGNYDPTKGDYPDIKGDEALFFIFNDTANRQQAGPAMGVEIHGMAYAYNTGGFEDSVFFTDYKIFNRSGLAYTDVYLSLFADFDIGNSLNDLVGTDIPSNAVFSYDASPATSATTPFGFSQASAGIALLEGPPADYFDGEDNDRDGCVDGVRNSSGMCIAEDPSQGIREKWAMSSSNYFESPATTLNPLFIGPQVPLEAYQLQQGLCKNGSFYESKMGTSVRDAGNPFLSCGAVGTPLSFVYPGASIDISGAVLPSTPLNWFENPQASGDHRSMINARPFTLNIGQSIDFKTAFVWNRADSATSAANGGYFQLKDKLSRLKNLSENQPPRTVSLREHFSENNLKVFLNPEGKWFVRNESAKSHPVELYSASGQKLGEIEVSGHGQAEISLSNFSGGIYFLVAPSSGQSFKILR